MKNQFMVSDPDGIHIVIRSEGEEQSSIHTLNDWSVFTKRFTILDGLQLYHANHHEKSILFSSLYIPLI